MSARRQSRQPANRRAGYTLVELMFVIVIIALLGGMGYAGINYLYHRGRSMHCMNNMRGIGTALTLYAADHQNLYPTLVGARESKDSDEPAIDNTLDAYTESHDVFRCIEDHSKLYEKTGTSYFWNTILNGQSPGSLKFLRVKDQTRIPVIYDKENFHRYQGLEVNILFADGHVEKEIKLNTN